MSDDAYQKFQCDGNFWSQYHVNVLYVDSGNLLLGVARCLAFMMFIGFQAYNRILLNRKHANNVNVIKGLILPSYLPFMYFYMLFSVATGLIDLVNQARFGSERFDSWAYPIEIGITHWFSEGLAIFLMRYGAGIQAIRRSYRASLAWGIISTIWFIMIFSVLNGRFGIKRGNKPLLYGLFITYEVILLVFYATYAFVPSKFLYHRPALTFYARFNTLLTLIVILFATLYYKEVYAIVCPGSVIAFIFASFLQPLAIYKTLQIDSQYWQGLSPEPGNPLTEVWDHLGIETAACMAENLERFGRVNRKLPILHFGLMTFDTDLQFVAGGFSRVYFGSLRGERVAFKILFAMELDPKDVEEFYREAAVLHTLQHPNVVQCMGVCVMPPALTIVLELCKYGSLFDFLYKPVSTPFPRGRGSLGTKIRASLIDIRNSLLGLPPETDLDYSAGHHSSGLELKALGDQQEPSFSNPTGKATEGNQAEPHVLYPQGTSSPCCTSANCCMCLRDIFWCCIDGWRTFSMSTTAGLSFAEGDVTNPLGSSSVSSVRPYPPGVGSLVRSSAAGTGTSHSFYSTRSPSVLASNAAELYNHAAGLPSATTAMPGNGSASPLSSPGGSADESDEGGSGRRAGAPVDISSAGNSGDGAGSGAPVVQRSARTLAQMMQAPFRANDGGSGRAGSYSADSTPRPSASSTRAPLGPNLSFNMRLVMMRDAIAGIAHLHAKGYMHCDIKSLNFLVAEVRIV